MTATQIIAKFNLQVDDSSELSSTEALELANDVYQEVQDARPWEWLNATATGNTSTSVNYIALPSDFKEVKPNYNGLTSGSFNNLGVPAGYRPSSYANFANMPVVFVGTNRSPYRILPQSERNNFYNTDGFAYIDVPNSRLVFTKQPTSVQAVEYDYIKIATTLTTNTSPLFRSGFHKIIAYGMAAKFPAIEQADKATSYYKENQAMYDSILSDMAMEDASIKLSYC